jgi:DNA adenine methylase
MPSNVFPYPGNKARHADWILDHLPEHNCYVELFGGAAGVLFNKPLSKVEVYNDRDGDIVQFFEVLRNYTDDLIQWLEGVPYSRELYRDWAEEFYNTDKRPSDPIERAGKFFFLRYAQFSGKLDGVAGFSIKHDVNPAGQLKRKIDKLERFADRLRNVQIENRDWSDVVGSFDTPETVFYADPPYIDRENLYNSEGFDHRKLHDGLLNLDADVIVSYDEVPPFYSDDWFVLTKNVTSQVHSGSHRDYEEVLLMNFDAAGESVMSDVGQQTLSDVAD